MLLRALQDICDWLESGKLVRHRAELHTARAERDRASKALSAARLVGDTRSIRDADAAYKAATHTALRAEIALRMAEPRRDRSKTRSA